MLKYLLIYFYYKINAIDIIPIENVPQTLF